MSLAGGLSFWRAISLAVNPVAEQVLLAADSLITATFGWSNLVDCLQQVS